MFDGLGLYRRLAYSFDMRKLDAISLVLCKEAGFNPTYLAPAIIPAMEAYDASSRAPSGEGARAGILAGTGSLLGTAAGGVGGGILGKTLANRMWAPNMPAGSGNVLRLVGTVLGTVGGGALGGVLGGSGGEALAKSTSDNPYYRAS